MDDYYRRYNANVHRGVHTLSEEATAAYEEARASRWPASSTPPATSRSSLRAARPKASTWSRIRWGAPTCDPGDEVLITEMEHHSNIVPWQILREQVGFTLRYVPITDAGTARPGRSWTAC